MAAELVHRRVSVLASTGGEPAARAAKAATSSIPIVFAIAGDRGKEGLAATFSRSGGNTTGISGLKGRYRHALSPVWRHDVRHGQGDTWLYTHRADVPP